MSTIGSFRLRRADLQLLFGGASRHDDGRTRRHMSVLCTSNVQPELLLCVNKDDRKWQFGSSNQECHSPSRPLPAPDTLTAEEVTAMTPLSLRLSSAPFLPSFICFAGHFISVPPMQRFAVEEETEWCAENTSQSDGGTFPPPNALIKHEACHVRLSWQLNVKISATSLWNRDAHVRSRPASSGQSCQDLLLKDSEDGNSERVQHR